MKSHKGLEELREAFVSQIKEMEESPAAPTALMSDKLFFELSKERVEAQQRSAPSIEAPGHISRLFRAMGFEPAQFTTHTEAETTSYGKHKAMIERMGFPEKCCERTIMQLAMCEIGKLLKPDMIFSDGHGCDADHRYTSQSLSDWFNIPMFFVDVPINEDDKPDLVNLNYIADQLGEFIEYAESKVPKVKYNEDRHIEILELCAIGEKYRREIYQLIKHVPCPIGPQDAISARSRLKFQPERYPNIHKANEYLRVCRDELGERVASGKGPYPEERLRLLWAGQVHDLQAVNPTRVLLERKVALPLPLQGATLRQIGLSCAPIGEVSEYGVKLSPLQEEARMLDSQVWGGPGKRWVNSALLLARDIGAHGILHFNLIGCTPMRSMGSVVAERAEKELGIPTLNFEGRQMDRDYLSQERFEEILSFFIDKCFDQAGKPRQ